VQRRGFSPSSATPPGQVAESAYGADASTVVGVIVDLHDCLIVSLAERRSAKALTFDRKASRRLGMGLLR
jgi:hypothetical protein